MKKTILLLFIVFIFCLGGCDYVDNPIEDDNNPTNSIISVYDNDMNLINKFTYQAPEDNTIDTTQFEKVGYKFEGIYDLNTSVMLFNSKGNQSPTVMLDNNFKAVVKYSPISYQIIFEAEEGKLDNADNYIKNICYDESLGVFPSASLEGMEFDGWFDEAGKRYSFASSPVYTKFTSESFSVTGEVIKLYARYSTRYCNVSLNYGDGTNNVQLKVVYGQKLPNLSEYFKDDGSRVVTGFGVSYSSQVSFDDIVYTDLELYAIWKDYTYVTFVYTENDIKKEKVYRDGNVAVLPEGVREGYVFEGWYTSELLSGNKVTSTTFGNLSNTYYAKWSLGSYTIQFIADGKVISSSTFNIENQDITVPEVPVKNHYEGSWESYELEYKDIIVNAIYEPEKIKITLISGYDYSYSTVKYGDNFTLMIPYKKGYEFKGWYYNDKQVTDIEGKSLQTYTFDGNITLTAKWESTKCTLSFETNGGTQITSVKVDYGTPYTLTQTPEREGYYFGGWYDDTLIEEYINTITITADTIIYAKWIKSTPIYDVDGLKAISENPYGNYHLTTNINLRGEVWEPIEEFYGILNGDGYKIYNFSLKKDDANLAFIITNKGTIKNLSISNVELSNTVDTFTCSISVFCAYNEGSLVNISIENVNALVNVKNSNVNNAVNIGMLVGVSSGKIISCMVESSLTINTNLHGHYNSYSTDINVGGLCGKNLGKISTVKSTWNITINEYVSASSGGSAVIWQAGWKNVFLSVGSICGTECGNLTNAIVNVKCSLYSNGSGTTPSRYTYIGGVDGRVLEGGSVSNCYSYGSADLARVGKLSDSYEFYNGGIVGKVENGTVNNCASSIDLTLTEGYGGYIAGIAGCISKDGRVTNTAYYGTVNTVSFTGGTFTGLVGLVEGVFTKGYFHGKILTDSENKADIVGKITSSGSVSKTIDNGNCKTIFCTNEGSSTNNYIIDVDYGDELLSNQSKLFDELCLFETNIWGIDDEIGLYLISFPEYNLPEI